MRSLTRSVFGLALVFTMILGSLALVTAAHNGNSKADLIGTGEPGASGQSVVNFRKGTESFNGSVHMSDLDPGATYSFLVRNAAGVERLICTGMSSGQGLFVCGANDVLPDNFGLRVAVVRDAAGVEIASGIFDRRGNCRVPDQAGSQCEAPGHDGP